MITVREEDIDKITEAFYLLLKGKRPPPIELPADYPDNEIKQAVDYINNFLAEYSRATDFTYTLSKGDLNFEAPKGRILFLQSLKSLQASLRHLTWKTQQIAKGDFNQQVDFMGDFSEAFNSMVQQLENSFTERKQANEALQNQVDELAKTRRAMLNVMEDLEEARKEAEAATQAKSDFLANVSHELRTPLNAIIGYSEMLMEDAEDTKQYALIADLQKIHASGKHLLALINDILDLSKIEAGKQDLFLEAFDVREMIMDVVNTVRPLAEKNKNILEIHCADDLGAMCSDLTRVRQMLFNLLSNACKFTEQGIVTLKADRETAEDDSWLTLRVGDTGIGMTEEQMARIFEPFSQAEANITSRYGGTGLGLAITRRFCEMMGGDISVTSTYRVGSVFMMRLPLKDNGV